MIMILSASSTAVSQDRSLFAQAVQAALSKPSFAASAPVVSWLVLDARTGQLLASNWAHADRPVPVGSLTKPFIAIAYASTHPEYPHYACAGKSTRCWLPRGHGTLNLEQALAFSCNSYFLHLAEETSPDAILRIALDYHLPAPREAATPLELIGIDPTWRIPPLALARAYAQLATQSHADAVLAGMRQAALHGTAGALAGADALAKTGTAHCLEGCVASVDGFVVALTPRDDPTLLLLVRERGTTGAATAGVAARMLHSLREEHVLGP